MRKVERHPVEGVNSLWFWHKTVSPVKVVINFLIIYIARYLPWLWLKNIFYRAVGMKVGKNVSVGLMVMFDIFFPELVEIGDNSILGYNTTILCHEYLVDEWRTGTVKIGKNVMIGANVTVLPGVEIGDGAVISACSLVNADVPKNSVVGGVPIRRLK
ncbi:MAG: acyltransferase [Thermoanaerobacterales bacterium]|nr:acyltransferase [Thermoanaerobacterales bacterium]